MKLTFEKMTALGNDFIMVDGREYDPESILPKVEQLCDRRFGIGADGVIFILPGENDADFTMRIINSDGSEAEMCGNGIRCFARWIDDRELFSSDELNVSTLAGVKVITREDSGYRVNMGTPELEPERIPVISLNNSNKNIHISTYNSDFQFTAVSMGNPHAVIFVDRITDELVLDQGSIIETAPLFPRKTNVEFIQVISESEVEMRVWERGCGETLACGTGACAAVVAGVLNNLHGNDITVHLRGGDLRIEWDGKVLSPVFMTGDAHPVFTGEIAL